MVGGGGEEGGFTTSKPTGQKKSHLNSKIAHNSENIHLLKRPGYSIFTVSTFYNINQLTFGLCTSNSFYNIDF